MKEANNNVPLNSESNVEFGFATDNQQQHQHETEKIGAEKNSASSDLRLESTLEQNQLAAQSIVTPPESSEQKMDWQKVAHKLREYNRKLLKKVFRLEQDLAEVENKFDKQIDKARSSDLLVAQQAEEIKTYQEEIAKFERKGDRQTAKFQQLIDTQKISIGTLTQQYELSQQQTARIERDCITLKEDYNNKVYELATKEQKIKDLKARLSQQQRYAIQYKAEVQRYEEQIAALTEAKATEDKSKSKSLDRRSIEPWSVATTAESKIALPQTMIQSNTTKQTLPISKTVKTAAQIVAWNASEAPESQRDKSQNKSKSAVSKKPQSLAAVDLPTFPRPR